MSEEEFTARLITIQRKALELVREIELLKSDLAERD